MEKETADETREKQCKTAKKGEDNKERKGNRQGRHGVMYKFGAERMQTEEKKLRGCAHMRHIESA